MPTDTLQQKKTGLQTERYYSYLSWVDESYEGYGDYGSALGDSEDEVAR